LIDQLIDAACPACGHQVAVSFLDSDPQPLATGGWPASAEAAMAMPRLPLDFVRCLDCGHIFNRAFDYALIPYSAKPYRMFNSGVHWSEFMAGVMERLTGFLPKEPTVIEIGHGDGGFLASLAAQARADGSASTRTARWASMAPWSTATLCSIRPGTSRASRRT